MYISWAYVNGQGHEETTLENMLYAYFSLIFERISLKLGWYIGSISFYKPMNFQSVCQMSMSQWDKITAQ